MGAGTAERPLRVGFLASHGGSAAQTITRAGLAGNLDIQPVVMISNNSASPALSWARDLGLETHHISTRTHPEPGKRDLAMCEALREAGVGLVVLSGYNQLVGPTTLGRFRNRILNTHPAPLPDFGGHGMYGLAVHDAVLRAGLTVSAVTIHLIDEAYDHGPPLADYPVPIGEGFTPEDLAAAAKAVEGDALVLTIAAVLEGGIELDNPGPARRLVIDTTESRASQPETLVGGEAVGPWELLEEHPGSAGYVKVTNRKYRLPDGTEAVWDIFGGCDRSVAVLALTDDGEVVLARQYRPGPGLVLDELPGGGVHEGEDVLDAAARELLEETGYAGEVELAGSSWLASAARTQRYIAVVRHARRVGVPRTDPGEFCQVVRMDLERFRAHLRSGQLTDVDLGYLALDHLGLL